MQIGTYNYRLTQLAALLLLVLGQLSASVHALEHGIADQPERCATCVHLDQGGDTAPRSAAAIAFEPPAEPDGVGTVQEPSDETAASFDARAPPIS